MRLTTVTPTAVIGTMIVIATRSVSRRRRVKSPIVRVAVSAVRWQSSPESANGGPRSMPTYEYACRSCSQHLEVVQSFRDDPLTECPNCGGVLRKVFQPVGIAFK